MQPLYIFILTWIICGGIAWRVAKSRNASGALWAVIGQVFGPLSIPFAFMAKPKA